MRCQKCGKPLELNILQKIKMVIGWLRCKHDGGMIMFYNDDGHYETICSKCNAPMSEYCPNTKQRKVYFTTRSVK